jgi:serine/threonine-protein kinase
MPFQADTPMGMLIARLQYSPRPPREYRGDLPEPVEDVIMRALARKPEARYASAGALVQALKRAAELRGQTFAPAQPPVSPPQGTPRAPSGPPISQPAGVLPAQLAGLKGGIAPTQPASPNGGALPTQPAGTPPYVIPAVGPTQAMPRMATPPHLPIANHPGSAAGATEIRAPQERPARSSRGLLLGIGAVVLLLVLAGGAFAFFQGRADPRVEQGLRDASAALEQKGGFDRALKAYSDVLAIDGQNVTAHSRRALILNLRGHYDEAEQAARAALAADPNAAQAHAMLAEALASQNDYEAALTSANSAISSGEQVSSGYNARATIRADRAVIESDEALLQQAEADAEKALTLADKEGNLAKSLAHRARGYVYWQEYSLENDDAALDRGIEQFNRAVGLQGQIAEFHVDLGYFYDQQGERDRAREQFEAALDIDPGYGHLHAGLGWNLYYLGDYDGALNEFDQALALSPQDVDAMIGRSRVFQYRSEPDYDAAIAALDQAAKAAPKSTVLFSYLGWAYRSKAIELEYASEEQRSVYSEAEYHFREALKRNEKYYDALTGLGWVLQEQGDILQDTALYDEAISILQQSLDLRDDQAYAHVALGWSLYGQQKYDEAATAFEQATVELDTYAYAYYGLGRAREAQGQTDQAQQAYQTAVANGSTQAQDALAKLK